MKTALSYLILLNAFECFFVRTTHIEYDFDILL